MITYIKENPIKLIAVVGLLGIVLYLFLTADPQGYCGEQKRFLSDEEFIEIAVRDEYQHMKIDGSDVSIRTFHAKHPNCCVVSRGGDKSMGIEADNVVVRLRFETNQILYSAIKTKYYEHYAVISPCGIVLDSYGQDLKTIPDDY